MRSAAALLAFGVGAKASPPIAVEDRTYRPATAVPASWKAFATQLQAKFEQRLAGDDGPARQFQDYLTRRSEDAHVPPLSVVLRVWVLAEGNVDRVEFDGIDDPRAIHDLRALLTGGNVGVPPPEMLQPLHLRLSLRAKDLPRRGD